MLRRMLSALVDFVFQDTPSDEVYSHFADRGAFIDIIASVDRFFAAFRASNGQSHRILRNNQFAVWLGKQLDG